MDCLVTGGAGFIGSNLVDALVARGDAVTVVDDLTTGKRENLQGALEQGAVLHELDIRDAGALQRMLASVKPDVVFHLAAQVDVRRSVADPVHDAHVNVLGTIAVLQAARQAGCRRVVNSSTGGGLYGEASARPTPEDHAIRPLAPYGQAKLAAEGYCDLYALLHGLSTVSLRYGNVYGPRQDIHGEAGVVAIFCGCLVDGQPPTVFGDGTQTRDWVEVGDIVRANLLAADSSITGAVNIGTGHETSVLDLLAALSDVDGRGPMPDPVLAPARAGEVKHSCLDSSRASRELGWNAEVGLADGLRRTLSGL
jgi:UDP-glucose 4-epimerase